MNSYISKLVVNNLSSISFIDIAGLKNSLFTPSLLKLKTLFFIFKIKPWYPTPIGKLYPLSIILLLFKLSYCVLPNVIV